MARSVGGLRSHWQDEEHGRAKSLVPVARMVSIQGVSRTKAAIQAWSPALIWMALIFVASADRDSGSRSSRLLAPFIRWFVPDISPEALESCMILARKCVHFVSFGILAVLIWHGLTRGRTDAWRPRYFWMALALTALYAISDEVHQLFVPTREGSLRDVAIDTLGAAVALAGTRRIGRRRRS